MVSADMRTLDRAVECIVWKLLQCARDGVADAVPWILPQCLEFDAHLGQPVGCAFAVVFRVVALLLELAERGIEDLHVLTGATDLILEALALERQPLLLKYFARRRAHDGGGFAGYRAAVDLASAVAHSAMLRVDGDSDRFAVDIEDILGALDS